MKTDLNGMYAALLTGFDDDGAFCPKRQANIIDYVAGQGLHGLYIGGSSGESGMMSPEELLEQQRVIHGMRDRIPGKIIAHVGLPSVRDSVRLAKQAKTLEFEAISALPPHAYPFSDAEILAYYAELASATDLPLIVYEIPFRTNRPLPMPLLLKLLDLPRVEGIKFTSSDLYKLYQLRDRRPDKTYFFGSDEIYVPAASLAPLGGIGTTYNTLGKLYVAAFDAMNAGDLDTARTLQRVSQSYVEILLEIGVVPGTKLTLEILGHDVGPARRPMALKTDSARDDLSRFMGRPDVKIWFG